MQIVRKKAPTLCGVSGWLKADKTGSERVQKGVGSLFGEAKAGGEIGVPYN